MARQAAAVLLLSLQLRPEQRGASAQRGAAAPRNGSSAPSTTSKAATSTTRRIRWPACPAKGCLPCPKNAYGRPDCYCLNGYTTTGVSVALGGQETLVWDRVQGWTARCLPVTCGPPPTLAHSKRIDGRHPEDPLVFPERTRYVCETGYFVDGYTPPVFDDAPGEKSEAEPLIDGHPAARVITVRCSTNGTLTSDEELLCAPKCGDGRLMPVDHLPMYDPREQCDDGNLISGDGCSKSCRVEAGWICAGGGPTSPDSCGASEVGASSTLVLSLSGDRTPSPGEISNATAVALGAALGCPARDVEVGGVTASSSSLAAEAGAKAEEGQQGQSKFHGSRLSVQVSFLVKVSQPKKLSIDQIAGELRNPSGLLPRLWVGYTDFTSLKDVYVKIVHVAKPSITGDESKGRPEKFSLSRELTRWSIQLSPLYSYIILIAGVFPALVWLVRIRPRRYKLHGRFNDIAPEFRGNWAFNICTCIEHRMLCCSLLFCVPSRLAETWDILGLLPFWQGVRRATCCCILYLIPGCQPCGAAMAGQMRSNIRDFFGFGDDKEGNLEFADCCCYLCCPICCIVQEARHVDQALRVLPPPVAENPDWMFDVDSQHYQGPAPEQQAPEQLAIENDENS